MLWDTTEKQFYAHTHTPSTGVPESPLQVEFCDRTEYMVNDVYCVQYVWIWCAHSHIHTLAILLSYIVRVENKVCKNAFT